MVLRWMSLLVCMNIAVPCLGASLSCSDVFKALPLNRETQRRNLDHIMHANGDRGQSRYEDSVGYVGLSALDIWSLITTGKALDSYRGQTLPPINVAYTTDHPEVAGIVAKKYLAASTGQGGNLPVAISRVDHEQLNRKEATDDALSYNWKRILMMSWLDKLDRDFPNAIREPIVKVIVEMASDRSNLPVDVVEGNFRDAFFAATDQLADFRNDSSDLDEAPDRSFDSFTERVNRFYALLHGINVDAILEKRVGALDDSGEEPVFRFTEAQRFINGFLRYEGMMPYIAGVDSVAVSQNMESQILNPNPDGIVVVDLLGSLSILRSENLIDLEASDQLGFDWLTKLFSRFEQEL